MKNRKKIPILATIILVLGFIWLLTDLGYIRVNIPWIPVVLIIIAIGIIINRYLNE